MGQWEEGWLGPYRRKQANPLEPEPERVPEPEAPPSAIGGSDWARDPRDDPAEPLARIRVQPEDQSEEDFEASLPQPPRRASERVWKFVRQDYLSGLTAGQCGRRWGVKVPTLRARAAAEGWRRADQPPPPDPEPLHYDAPRHGDDALDPGPDPMAEAPGVPDGPADYAGMARRALARFDRALARGAATEAATWLRLHARLLDLARVAEAHAAVAARRAPPPPEPADPVEALNACVIEIESIARAALTVADDDHEAQAALEARTAAVHARISEITGADDMDSIDSIDSLFSADGVDPPADPPEPPP